MPLYWVILEKIHVDWWTYVQVVRWLEYEATINLVVEEDDAPDT